MNTREIYRDVTEIKGKVRCVIVSCDTCPNETFEYEGSPGDAKTKIRQNGWTIGSTGVVRGPMCSQVFAAILSATLGKAHA